MRPIQNKFISCVLFINCIYLLQTHHLTTIPKSKKKRKRLQPRKHSMTRTLILRLLLPRRRQMKRKQGKSKKKQIDLRTLRSPRRETGTRNGTRSRRLREMAKKSKLMSPRALLVRKLLVRCRQSRLRRILPLIYQGVMMKVLLSRLSI